MSYTIEQTVSIRGYTQSLVHELCIYKGSQWVVFDPTDVCVYAYKGPLVFKLSSFDYFPYLSPQPFLVQILCNRCC